MRVEVMQHFGLATPHTAISRPSWIEPRTSFISRWWCSVS